LLQNGIQLNVARVGQFTEFELKIEVEKAYRSCYENRI